MDLISPEVHISPALLAHLCGKPTDIVGGFPTQMASSGQSVSIWSHGVWVNHLCTQQTWWRHQMETFSVILVLCVGNSPVIGEFPSQRPVPRSFDVFFDLRLNTRLNKQSRGWWFETPSRPLWRHMVIVMKKTPSVIDHRVSCPQVWRHRVHDANRNLLEPLSLTWINF